MRRFGSSRGGALLASRRGAILRLFGAHMQGLDPWITTRDLVEAQNCTGRKSIPDSLELFPIDNTESALKLFQPLADEVFEHEGEGYTILLPHASSLFPGGYDMLLLQRLVAD